MDQFINNIYSLKSSFFRYHRESLSGRVEMEKLGLHLTIIYYSCIFPVLNVFSFVFVGASILKVPSGSRAPPAQPPWRKRGAEQYTGGANPIVVNIPKIHIQTTVDDLNDRLSQILCPIIVCGGAAQQNG